MPYFFQEQQKRRVQEISVKKDRQKDFENALKKNNTPFVKIGQTCKEKLVIKDDDKTLIKQPVKKLRDFWKNAISDIMG